YRWPQYAVHRGQLQMLLYRIALERLGPDAIRTGLRVTGYRNTARGVVVKTRTRGGVQSGIPATQLSGAHGRHWAVRAQMQPEQQPIQRGGALRWRGMSPGVPIRTGAWFVGLGTHRHRVVFYPTSPPSPETGLATINWIAEIT